MKNTGTSCALAAASGFLIAAFAFAEESVERHAGKVGDLTSSARVITAKSGEDIEVEAGVLLVAETRGRSDRVVSIPFYRLATTSDQPEAPIFLLAGGPGSSWIDRFENPENFAEAQFYRGIADVVLFDQRGAGHSLPRMECDDRGQLPSGEAINPEALTRELRDMSARCRRRWVAAGVDLRSYTTQESANDVLALQAALGYDRMTLVGGSYGAHLALALMRKAPERIERVILSGVEGLDHTWDDPAAKLAALERIAGAAEVSQELATTIPEGGLLEALRVVVKRLEADPVLVEVSGEDGSSPVSVMVDALAVRRFAAFQAGRRSRPNAWPEFILRLYREDYSQVARGALALRSLRIDEPLHYMMDCSSGVSPERAARYAADRASDLLGDINYEYRALCVPWDAADLGTGFRAPLVSDIPTLIVHGTWDTSTPIENAREVVAGLSNGHLVEVIGGTHGALYNLYAYWEPAYRLVEGFLRGQDDNLPSSVTLPPVTFTSPMPVPESASAP